LRFDQYFSQSYAQARARFLDQARAAGATLHELALDARGPADTALYIDIAWLGSATPERVFLHTTGVHGVEAYTGSAAQLALLQRPPAPGPRDAFVLVHVLNPYGMAWLRRTNENNVDLNRNFLAEGETWAGAPALYAALDPLLNPASPPTRDAFMLRALGLAAKHGMHRVKQAIAEGQYEYPRGLFYGGRELQQGPRLYTAWLQQYLSSVAYLFALDLHTGLGRHGRDIVAPEPKVGVTPLPELAAAIGRPAKALTRPSVAYTVRGAMGAALPRLLPGTQVDFLLQEIGTYSPVRVLHALREENRWHFHGDGDMAHPAKQQAVEALCPASAEWRTKAVSLATEVASRAASWTFR
jgi:hypothetical protein